jgi:hypothetical protein
VAPLKKVQDLFSYIVNAATPEGLPAFRLEMIVSHPRS